MTKLKIEEVDDVLNITKADLSVEETVFVIHTLIACVANIVGIEKEEVYQDIGIVYNDAWCSK